LDQEVWTSFAEAARTVWAPSSVVQEKDREILAL